MPKPMSVNNTKFYIDGEWVEPATPQLYEVINPATEEPAGQISMGSSADVDRAVAAARRAFPSYSATSREERIELLNTIIKLYNRRGKTLAKVTQHEMQRMFRVSRESVHGAAKPPWRIG